mmetsp:Transcript_27309/g.49446  ORF Transcript_27309/g.49446 Transcript_27309/m.49446 type:complete len:378 (+) Transcript_27309:49-1182(+)
MCGQVSSLQSSLTPKDNVPDVLSVLDSVVRKSGAQYALFWGMSAGRLAVQDEWTTGGHIENFTDGSRLVSLRPGQGIVGRVFKSKRVEFLSDVSGLSAAVFSRLGLAQRSGVRSIACFPWNNGVIEYGSTQVWEQPPLCEISIDCSFHGPAVPALWEAVLWKQSNWLGLWRQRSLTMTQEKTQFRLISRHPQTQQVTGRWTFEKGAKTKLSSNLTFSSVLELQGVTLAESTGSGALQQLCRIIHDENSESQVASLHRDVSPTCSEATVDETCSSPRSWCSSPQLSPTASVNSERFDMTTPCDTCSGLARGKVVARLTAQQELSKWLCKDCFISSWEQLAMNDGRFQERPRWLLLTSHGTLLDATPSEMHRYRSIIKI